LFGIRCSVAAFWGNATIFVADAKRQHTTADELC